MSTLLVLSDGRIWGTSNGCYDSLLELTAEALAVDDEGTELAGWLLNQRCEVQGPGVGYVDLRELTPDAQQRLVEAIPEAVVTARTRGPRLGSDPSYFPKFIDELERVTQMVESMARGEPPENLTTPFWKLHPPSGEHKGPGWPVSPT